VSQGRNRIHIHILWCGLSKQISEALVETIFELVKKALESGDGLLIGLRISAGMIYQYLFIPLSVGMVPPEVIVLHRVIQFPSPVPINKGRHGALFLAFVDEAIYRHHPSHEEPMLFEGLHGVR
jgi:hypothetical protein